MKMEDKIKKHMKKKSLSSIPKFNAFSIRESEIPKPMKNKSRRMELIQDHRIKRNPQRCNLKTVMRIKIKIKGNPRKRNPIKILMRRKTSKMNNFL